MSNDGAPPPNPGSAPVKKALSPLAWVGIGCGSVAVIGVVVVSLLGIFVFQRGRELVEDATGSGSVAEFLEDMQDNPAKTAAETMIRMNPELDLIGSDDGAGTVTFGNTRTGEEATLNFEEIVEGRLSMTTSEGDLSVDPSGVTVTGPEGETRVGATADLSGVPDWVPVYPGATDTRSMMHSATADGVMGALTSTTSHDLQTVVDHFRQVFADQGYEIGSESVTTTGDRAFGAITGEQAGAGRSINVLVIENAGESQVTVNYNQQTQ